MRLWHFAVLSAGVFAAIYIVARAYAESHPLPSPLTIEQERENARLIVGTIPQHHPGVSVGEWTDEHEVDPAYDALEAIRGR